MQTTTIPSTSPLIPAAQPIGPGTRLALDLMVCDSPICVMPGPPSLLSSDAHTMTETHELHRRRRKPLEPFFSRLGISRIENLVLEEAKLLNDRLEAMKGSKTIVRLDHIFSAFASDVIGKMCCEDPPNMMSRPEFGRDWQGSPSSPYK